MKLLLIYIIIFFLVFLKIKIKFLKYMIKFISFSLFKVYVCLDILYLLSIIDNIILCKY